MFRQEPIQGQVAFGALIASGVGLYNRFLTLKPGLLGYLGLYFELLKTFEIMVH